MNPVLLTFILWTVAILVVSAVAGYVADRMAGDRFV